MSKYKRFIHNGMDFMSHFGYFVALTLIVMANNNDATIMWRVIEILGYIMVFCSSFCVVDHYFRKFTSGRLDIVIDDQENIVEIKKLSMNIPVEELIEYHDIPIKIGIKK